MVTTEKQGVFSAEDIEDMRKELAQEVTPDDSANDRNLRAVEIIERRNVERTSK